MSVLKFSIKLLPANMGFVNYFISKFSCDFHNTSFLAVFYKSCCPALVNANDEIFKLLLAWLKVGKHKNCSDMYFLKNFRTAIVQNSNR